MAKVIEKVIRAPRGRTADVNEPLLEAMTFLKAQKVGTWVVLDDEIGQVPNEDKPRSKANTSIKSHFKMAFGDPKETGLRVSIAYTPDGYAQVQAVKTGTKG